MRQFQTEEEGETQRCIGEGSEGVSLITQYPVSLRMGYRKCLDLLTLYPRYAASEVRIDEAVPIYETKPVDGDEQKCGIEFRYRSLGKSPQMFFDANANLLLPDSLRALHIVPMPLPLEEQDPGELSTERIAELQKLVRENIVGGCRSFPCLIPS